MRAKAVIKALVPPPVLHCIRQAHRGYIFRQRMKKFLKDIETCEQPGSAVIDDLIYGWGNEGWSASDEYISGCIQHALNTKGPMLECGSGLSTVLLGAIAKKRGMALWTLEHSTDWAEKVQECLQAYGIDSVTLCVTPLVDYGDFSWYDPPLDSMPSFFDLVVCDGPPGDTKGGRRGLVSIMGKWFQEGSIILLDDGIRADERKTARQWQSELNTSLEFQGRTRPYIKMKVQHQRH